MHTSCFRYPLLFVGQFLLLVSTKAQQQKADTSFIQPFSKENVVELHPAVYKSNFLFRSMHSRAYNFRMVANSSAYTSVYAGYKWLAVTVSHSLPFTQLDKNVHLKYNSLSFHAGNDAFSVHPFYNSYNGLLIPEKRHSRDYVPFKDMSISNAGTDCYYYANSKTFSYHAAYSFSKKQIKNAGSFIAGISPLWQKIKWHQPSRSLIEDSSTYTLLASDPQWLSLTGRLGYTCNIALHHGSWCIVPTVLLGAGGVKELYSDRHTIQSVSDLQGSLTAGYNGADCYLYLTAWYDNLKTNLFVKNLEERNSDISLTVGYRFSNSKRKWLGIL